MNLGAGMTRWPRSTAAGRECWGPRGPARGGPNMALAATARQQAQRQWCSEQAPAETAGEAPTETQEDGDWPESTGGEASKGNQAAEFTLYPQAVKATHIRVR